MKSCLHDTEPSVAWLHRGQGDVVHLFHLLMHDPHFDRISFSEESSAEGEASEAPTLSPAQRKEKRSYFNVKYQTWFMLSYLFRSTHH